MGGTMVTIIDHCDAYEKAMREADVDAAARARADVERTVAEALESARPRNGKPVRQTHLNVLTLTYFNAWFATRGGWGFRLVE